MAQAHYGCRANPVSRATGRSAVAAAAYRSAERHTDDRTGITHDYTRKQGVLHSEIMAPAGSPSWAYDRAAVWNAAEAIEDKSTRRAVAKTGRDFIIDLPYEVSAENRLMCARQFARHLCDTYGMVVDFAVHEPDKDGDQRNYHAHVLTSTRVMTDAGFGSKLRELDDPRMSAKHIEAIREKWAEIQNAAYIREGLDLRADHRSYEAQGLDKGATVHLGPSASAIERRGERSELGDKNREILADNATRDALKGEREVIGLEIRDEAAARAERQAERELNASVRTYDPAKILSGLTERRSTFGRAEVNSLLRPAYDDARERADMVNRILARPDVIGLRDTADGPVRRYTTREVLASEMKTMEASRHLDGSTTHGLTEWRKAEALDRHSHLDAEQRAAFDHGTRAGGFAVIAGEAGTGKSTTMAAIRDAYEDAGHRVIGLAWTNAVVQDMKDNGFRDAATIASELMRVERGSSQWNAKTVLIVDEAAMLSTKHLVGLMEKAEQAGAKVILTGDDKQLASIERGGMFGALRDEHGAAELHNVRRVTDADQRRAFNLMHKGDFRPALEIFDKQGAITWSQTQDEARTALVAKYATDTAAAPDKSRFVFANSNAEVMALNKDIRALRRERGELGEDHVLRSKDGPEAFATGDRIMFTGTAPSKQAKALGFINGNAGTIEKIDGDRVTVALDTKGGRPRLVAFNVGEDTEAGEFNAIRHGYAGTIYKGQGRTLDQTYVLHSASMGADSSYVGLSRHRDSVSLFTTRGAEAWISATGGHEGLTDKQLDSAKASYARWTEEKPELAQKYGFGDYVAYVQDQQAKRDPDNKADLDRLARQMSRTQERRSASQFIVDEPQPIRPGDNRTDFDEAASHTTGPYDEAKGDAGPTAQQQAEAQRKAAIIGRLKDPIKVAHALTRAHRRDTGASKAEGFTEAASRATGPQSADSDARSRVRAALADVQREAEKDNARDSRAGIERERPRGRTR